MRTRFEVQKAKKNRGVLALWGRDCRPIADDCLGECFPHVGWRSLGNRLRTDACGNLCLRPQNGKIFWEKTREELPRKTTKKTTTRDNKLKKGLSSSSGQPFTFICNYHSYYSNRSFREGNLHILYLSFLTYIHTHLQKLLLSQLLLLKSNST